MSGAGGARPGAGRPLSQLSKLAHRLIEAFPRGYQIAGESKGLAGSPEDIQREVIAQILADEIKAGRGINVVKLEADFIGRLAGRGDDKSAAASPLLEALSKCPGLLPVADPSLSAVSHDAAQEIRAIDTAGTPHSKCDGPAKLPFFDPQIPLDLDEA